MAKFPTFFHSVRSGGYLDNKYRVEVIVEVNSSQYPVALAALEDAQDEVTVLLEKQIKGDN